jgi:predicted transcriptional regulator of viral defense system
MQVRSLSGVEAQIVLSLEEHGVEELSLDTIQQYGHVQRGFARKLAHDLAAKGWLQRVGRGRYLLNPSSYGPEGVPDTDPLRVGSRLVRPYFFGYATAAELWGLLLQPGRVYYIVTPTRTSVHVAHPAQFRVIRSSPRRFFGATRLTRRGQSVFVSDPERTVLDCISRPELSGGLAGAAQVLARAKPSLSWDRLARYLVRGGNRSLALRVGFLAEHVRPALSPPRAWIEALLPSSGAPAVPLGPPRDYGRRGSYDPRWHLIRNVPDRVLLAEADSR